MPSRMGAISHRDYGQEYIGFMDWFGRHFPMPKQDAALENGGTETCRLASGWIRRRSVDGQAGVYCEPS